MKDHYPNWKNNAKAQGSEGRGDNPKTDDDLGLGPALLFEMMMNGRHKEDALVRKVEIDNLDHDRQGLDDKQTADDEGTTSVLVMMEVQAKAAPRASEPVSPIKMLAG